MNITTLHEHYIILQVNYIDIFIKNNVHKENISTQSDKSIMHKGIHNKSDKTHDKFTLQKKNLKIQ